MSVPFGEPLVLMARVRFPAPRLAAGPDASNLPRPDGRATLQVDGVTIASSATLNENDPLPICGDCSEPGLAFTFTIHDVPLGMHQLTARYESDGMYEASESEPLAHVVLPQLSAPTATGTGQSFIGTTSGDSMILRTSPVLTHSIGRVNHPPTYYEVLTQQQAPSNLRW